MSVTSKKEWIGESGYCNCLLVAMARVPIPTVHLFPTKLCMTLTLSQQKPVEEKRHFSLTDKD
jgi:hypothetical protein